MASELSMAARLPEESQKAVLSAMGASLVLSNQWECNLFGGKKSCTDVPSDSPLMKTCGGGEGEGGSGRKVDCAFKGEAVAEMSDDPRLKMREKLAKEGYPPCEPCFEALHKFWCGQTAPTCGTFEKVLDEILPALGQVAREQSGPREALASAFPSMLAALSLGMPCREMCSQVTDQCNCGRTAATVGQMLTNINRDRTSSLPSSPFLYTTNMSLATSRQLFSSVWNQPVCTLFAPKSMPGFVGACDVAVTRVTGRCGWCKGERGPSDADQQIVGQVAETMSNMMQGGLEHILDAASNGKWSHVRHWDWKEDEEPKKKSHGGWTLTVFLLLFLGTGIGVGATMWYVKRRKHVASTYVHLDDMEYNPPAL